MSNRFCYSYHRHPIAPTCCPQTIKPDCVTSSTLSTMATLSSVIFNSKGNSSQSMLLSGCLQQQQQQQQQKLNEKISTLIANSNQISSTLQGQLDAQVESRYTPYYRREPERIPESVMQLDRMTRNVGVPISVMTIANCKGVQFVTK